MTRDEADAAATSEAATMAEGFEGFSATPYRCPAGVWTIGFGSTRGFDGKPITAASAPVNRAQGHQLMERDLRSAMQSVRGLVQVPLGIHEEAALIDFVYNCGAGNLRVSTLLRKLNAGDYEAAAREFANWNKGGGKVLAGLVRRRADETALFRSGA